MFVTNDLSLAVNHLRTGPQSQLFNGPLALFENSYGISHSSNVMIFVGLITINQEKYKEGGNQHVKCRELTPYLG